ncbi:MAG: hypothetical protein IJU60_05775 [Acholeplasmatales bacterium]|nr:hypothetical protein [Acholeplasmatales bacterium]
MSRVREREIELLKKYYDIDEEKRVVTIPLKFDKASELIDDKIINKKNYIIDHDVLADMTSTLRRIPVGYTVDYELHIKDYEDYDPKRIVDSFNDSLELNNYNLSREHRRKILMAAIFLITGLSILFGVFVAKANNIFDNIANGDVFSEVFDIFAWVFIWEFITVLFLTPSELAINSKLFRLRVKTVKFYDENEKLLESIETGTTYFDWEDEQKLEKVAKTSLLISGGAFIAFGFKGLFEAIFDLIIAIPASSAAVSSGTVNAGEIALAVILLTGLSLLAGLIEIFGGVVALAIYIGKKNKKITIFSTIFAIVLFLIVALEIFTLVKDPSASNVISLTASIVISIIYFVAYIILLILKRAGNKKEKVEE